MIIHPSFPIFVNDQSLLPETALVWPNYGTVGNAQLV